MSFSVSCADPDIEFASHGLNGLFAQRSLLFSASYLRLLADVVRFGRRGRRVLASSADPHATIADFLEDGSLQRGLRPVLPAADDRRDLVVRLRARGRLPSRSAAALSRQSRSAPGHRPARVADGRGWEPKLHRSDGAQSLSDRIHLGNGVAEHRSHGRRCQPSIRGRLEPLVRSCGDRGPRGSGFGDARGTDAARAGAPGQLALLCQRHLAPHRRLADASAAKCLGVVELPRSRRKRPPGREPR